MDLNDDIIPDEIQDGKPVKDMTDRTTHITAVDYHKDDLEKLADTYNNIDKEESNKLYLLSNKYEFLFNDTIVI